MGALLKEGRKVENGYQVSPTPDLGAAWTTTKSQNLGALGRHNNPLRPPNASGDDMRAGEVGREPN